jgi:O-antigen ligase
MIRFGLIVVYSLGLLVLSTRDWFKALCGLILMMAVIEHPDMPKELLGIQGLNFWNLILLAVLVAWFIQRRREGLQWDMPKHISILLLLYLSVILIGFARMIVDHPYVTDTPLTLISELLINGLKWVIPGLLLYDGCRSQSRVKWALFSILGVYVLLALQVVRWMPASYAISGDQMAVRALKILVNEIGFHRVTMSMMLAGASWAVLAIKPLARSKMQTFLIVAAFFFVVYAQALTGGRAGYVSWATLGLLLCFVKWRKYLLLAPIVALLIVTLIPGVMERLTQGFTPETRDNNAALEQAGLMQNGGEAYTLTAGRDVAWRFVIAAIQEKPVTGYGRLAMQRTGIASFLFHRFGESFPHPHNAYLELLLDNGVIGFGLIIPFYLIVLKRSVSLFRDNADPLFTAVGGLATCLVLAFLLASFGSQSFYPVEASVGMWCGMGLMLRISVEREALEQRATAMRWAGAQEFGDVQPEPALFQESHPEQEEAVASAAAPSVRTKAVRNWRAAMHVGEGVEP